MMTDSTRTLENLELVGGALCLDFVNTVNSRMQTEHDYLVQYLDLVGWGNKVGLLSPSESRQLKKLASQNAKEAENVFDSTLHLRDLLHRLFSRAAHEREPNRRDFDEFVSLYGKAVAQSHLVRRDDLYKMTWDVDAAPEALLWPIIHSAGELLLSSELRHVKECPGCGWLFLDTSKNQSRRWCSMNTCGARDKMRRYHKRQHPE